MKLNFSKLQRLLMRREYLFVYDKGKKYVGKRLICFYLLNRHSPSKLGITITKKWGKAHDRNRFKRVVREGFRLSAPTLKQGLLLNVHPRTDYHRLSVEEVAQELKTLSKCCGETQSQPAKSC